MITLALPALTLIGLGFTPSEAQDKKPVEAYPFVFRDTAEEAGLLPDLTGIRGHGAGWGDVDGDGWIDLYVGTFHESESKPNHFFRNNKGKFKLDTQESLRISTRSTGILFADLDNDGDLDLYVGSMPKKGKMGAPDLLGCTLFRNDKAGTFTNIAKDNGACPTEFGGRSVTALDYDGDGLLDLLVGEDPNPGYNGSKTKSTRLFRNQGDLGFKDVSRDVGLPEVMPGLGVAAGDVNNDGWPDVFVASSNGGNILFLNDGKGKFVEWPDAKTFFAWEGSGGDNMICGACFADVNRDGLLDLVVGQHFSSPWKKPVPVRLYLNRGIDKGVPKFEDVTAKVGLIGLPMKAPHIELQDMDNDGWLDLYVSMVKFADKKPFPVIFKHQGNDKDGLPKFREDALGVNDFPNADDQAVKRTGEFFDKMVKDRKIIYMAPGPTADYDNDGKLDIFLPNWWNTSPSLLLHNETPGGNWLQIQLANEGEKAVKGVNRMGIGARLHIYTGGKLGDKTALLGCRDVAVGFGYASGQPAITHFGLGKTEKVDIEVILPHGKGKWVHKDVKPNQRLTLKP